MAFRHGFVDGVFGRCDAVDVLLADRVSLEFGTVEEAQFRRYRKLDDRLELRQHDFAERAAGAQQEDRPETLDRLLVALLARHGPDLASVAVPIDDEGAIGA